MSIITQALKKAQHEQRLQQTPQTQYGSLAPWRPKAQRQRSARRFSRRFAGLTAAGIGLLGAVGIAAYIGQPTRDPSPIAITAPATPPPASEPELSQLQATLTPDPQALERWQSASPPHPDIARSAIAPVVRALPTPPVLPAAQHRAPLTPVQTAGIEPEMGQAEKRARAQRQLNLGIAAYSAGVFDDAEVALQQAIALDPTLTSAFNRLGNVYYQRHAYQEALAMYQQALALDPDYIEARNNLGNTYMQLDMSAKAIAELHKAILVDRASGLTYYNLACVYARTSEPEQAIRYLEMAIAHEPEARHWAKTDSDFNAVRSISTFQKLLGMSS
jgi:tetratricopeptide (TPR) repeat protein